MEKITNFEILDIDDRIVGCRIENPDEDDDCYYIKIRFNFIADNMGGLGRHEFTSKDKQDILNQVKLFILDKNKGFKIVLPD